MKLSDGVEAAIHCVTALAALEGNETLTATALAEFHGVSPSYLLKHLKKLVAAGILESVSGPAGGYRLARQTDRISLADVVLAVEGPQPAFRCNDIRKKGVDPLPDDAFPLPCNINLAMLRAERAYRAELAKTSIAQLMDEFTEQADPRVVARGCAFRDRFKRPQGA